MKRYEKKTLMTVSRVMAASFLEDPMNAAQLEGIENKEKLLAAHSLLHTLNAVKTNSLFLLDGNPEAFIIGFDSAKENKYRDTLLMIKIFLKTPSVIGIPQMLQLWKNMKKHGKVLSFDWHKKFISGRHYRIKIIAVDKALRGSGAFRKLIAPAIEYSENEAIPMVLETHNPDNVGLYEHFGFKLVQTITSPHTTIQQFCMIRKPVKEP